MFLHHPDLLLHIVHILVISTRTVTPPLVPPGRRNGRHCPFQLLHLLLYQTHLALQLHLAHPPYLRLLQLRTRSWVHQDDEPRFHETGEWDRVVVDSAGRHHYLAAG